MMDGAEVHIGDTVYVLGIGAGTVSSVRDDGGFTVKTAGGEAYYRAGGFVGNQRRVFWHDPMIIVPPKDNRLWETYKAMTKNVYAMLEKLYREGIIREKADE